MLKFLLFSRRAAFDVALLLVALIFCASSARAQRLHFTVYTGNAWTKPSDVHIVQPTTNSDFTIRALKFDAKWWKEAPYYGLRLGSWFSEDGPVGADVELRHHKAFGRVDDLREFTGVIRGARVDGVRRVDEFVKDFRLTDGINTIGTNLYLRQGLGSSLSNNTSRGGRAQGYIGLGPTYYVTYAHSDVNGVSHPKGGYKGIGGGYNFFVGVRYGLTDRFALVGEIGYSATRKRSVDIGQGGRATLDIVSVHFNGGLSYTILD